MQPAIRFRWRGRLRNPFQIFRAFRASVVNTQCEGIYCLRMPNSGIPYSTGLPLATNILAMVARDFGLDLVHQLHRLDDAEHLAFFNRVADLDERRRARRRRFVVGADDGRLHDEQVGVGSRFCDGAAPLDALPPRRELAGTAGAAQGAPQAAALAATGRHLDHRSGELPRLTCTFMSPRSSSNSVMSFSTRSSMSSLISF